MQELGRPALSRLAYVLVAALLWSRPAGIVLAQSEEAEQTAIEAHVSVRGLRLVTTPYNGEQAMRAFNWYAGTTLALQVDVPKGGLIELDALASRLESVTDDKGTDLQKKDDEGAVASSGVGGLAMFSEDGKAAMIEISAPQTPDPAAMEIRARGTLAFKLATVKKTYKDVVTLEKNSPMPMNPAPVTPRAIMKLSTGR